MFNFVKHSWPRWSDSQFAAYKPGLIFNSWHIWWSVQIEAWWCWLSLTFSLLLTLTSQCNRWIYRMGSVMCSNGHQKFHLKVTTFNEGCQNERAHCRVRSFVKHTSTSHPYSMSHNSTCVLVCCCYSTQSIHMLLFTHVVKEYLLPKHPKLQIPLIQLSNRLQETVDWSILLRIAA